MITIKKTLLSATMLTAMLAAPHCARANMNGAALEGLAYFVITLAVLLILNLILLIGNAFWKKKYLTYITTILTALTVIIAILFFYMGTMAGIIMVVLSALEIYLLREALIKEKQ